MSMYSFSDICFAIKKTTTKISQKFNNQCLRNNINLIALTGENNENELKKQREDTLELLNEILPKIKEQLNLCRNINDKYSDWVAISADLRAKFLKKSEEINSEYADVTAKLNGLCQRKNELINEEQKCTDLIAQKSYELNKKRKSVEKWCWVPGYNIYLLTEYENSLKSYKREHDNIIREIATIQNEFNEILDELPGNEMRSNNMKKLLQLFNNQSNYLNNSLNTSKGMTYEWNQAYDFFVKLKSDLETIEDFEELLTVAEQHLTKTAEKEKEVITYYSILDMDQIYMGNYHIRSYDNNYLAMSKNSEMIVTNDENDENAILTFVTLTNGTTIIINNEFYVAKYNPNSQIRFQSIELLNDGVINEECFYITPDDNNSNLYHVVSNENDELCLDINEGTQMSMCQINGSNNQSFILEKLM